ncbi:MAG: prepilin-type N-terminal cleavage/methylation domain-containing protein [Phycisphaerales bacterium]|nr:prepilin-type N-terminal cleavage/methylation domain-containing protein [Phycisphaerales bacterium]
MNMPGTASQRVSRGFTLVEIIVAGVIMAMLFGAIAVSLGQITSAKNTSRERMDAYIRADMALRSIQADLLSVLRRQDLFQTWVLLEDDSQEIDNIELARDWIVVFNNHLRAIRTIDYNGEGIEYESSWQVLDDDDGPVLWQRRDALPDTYPRAGGLINPVVEGIVELNIEAWDGEQWLSEWDSDYDGIPRGFRITVTATGAKPGEEGQLNAPLVTLRTIAPLDRSPHPQDVLDWKLAEQIALDRNLPPEQIEDIADAIANGTSLPLTVTSGNSEDEGLTGMGTPGQSQGRVSGVPAGLPTGRPSAPGGSPAGAGGGR